MIEGCELDTDFLPSDEAAVLQSLVEQSDLPRVQSAHAPDARDQLCYEVTVQTSEGAYHISFDDMTIPESIVPLIDYLRSRAKPRPLM